MSVETYLGIQNVNIASNIRLSVLWLQQSTHKFVALFFFVLNSEAEKNGDHLFMCVMIFMTKYDTLKLLHPKKWAIYWMFAFYIYQGH